MKQIKNIEEVKDINLVRKLSWQFHFISGIAYDEIFSEACLQYYEAVEKYDPTFRTKFSTYLWHHIRGHLLNFIKAERVYQSTFSEDLEQTNDIPVPDNFENKLNDDMEYVFSIVKRSKNKYIFQTQKRARQRLYRVLRHNGWNSEKINKVERDFKKIL